MFLRGTLGIADHGCSLVTRLVVTGPAKGRLLNLDYEEPLGRYVVEDTDFLAWYERWLDRPDRCHDQRRGRHRPRHGAGSPEVAKTQSPAPTGAR